MNYSLENIAKNYGDHTVFKNLNLEIPKNNITAIIGPSGCGKSTLLKVISGLEEVSEGTLNGFKGLNFSFVFQNLRLLPWKTVYENIDFVLSEVNKDKLQRELLINDILNQVHLKEYASYYPNMLSGGMQQRLAIARAFAVNSDMLLLDEAFKSLDFILKQKIVNLFLELWKKDQRTTVFVTHDIDEAVLCGDKIVLMDKNPTRIVKQMNNPLPLEQRSVQHSQIINFKEEIYKFYK